MSEQIPYRYSNKKHLNVRNDKVCTICGNDYKGTVIQVTCSKECRAIKNQRHVESFMARNPAKMKEYNRNRLSKNPDAWKKAKQKERSKIIEALGGQCIVKGCGVSKIAWLHIDYIPTMIGTNLRHPRHSNWVLANIKDFRLLCANHHYELTLTGTIEGTDIKQKNRNDKR